MIEIYFRMVKILFISLDNHKPLSLWWLTTVTLGSPTETLRFFQGGPVKLDSMWQHRLTRPLHVQHTYYRIIFKQNPFNIISRGVQR